MTTLSLRLPDSLHRQLKELAERDGVSINQFVALAVAEKVSVRVPRTTWSSGPREGIARSSARSSRKSPTSSPRRSLSDLVDARPTQRAL